MQTRKPRIAILGAGPVGLEAALAAVEHDYPFTLYEAGPSVGANVRSWGHVRLFSPWNLDVSPRMRRRLAQTGLGVPENGPCPTGDELVDRVLSPLAALPEISRSLRLETRVISVGREALLKNDAIGDPARGRRPFRLLLADPGGERIGRARIVLDCTGGYSHPNALGDGGIPAPGERALGDEIVRRIPDFSCEAEAWAGKTILLVGAGHSAQTAARDLAELAARHPGTRLIWALRREAPAWEKIEGDPLAERAHLAEASNALTAGDPPAIETACGVVVDEISRPGDKIRVGLRDILGKNAVERRILEVDRVLALTGHVGDHNLYRQLQIHECYATSGPMKLAAALLGESGGDCLTQESRGAETLTHPEPGFFILGSKSYGRNNTFLMRVGWQQVEEVFRLLNTMTSTARGRSRVQLPRGA